LSDPDIDAYERLLDVPDHDLYTWVTNDGVAPEFDTPLFRKLCDFHRVNFI
jgi:antitoxin CptB